MENKRIVAELRGIVDGLKAINVDHLQQKTMTEAADIIESLTWVSVDEKLPKCDSKYGVSNVVWCADAQGKVGFGIYQDGTAQLQNEGWFIAGKAGEGDIKITHWMPIPKPSMVEEVNNGNR